MALIEREGDRIWISSEFREKELVKMVPGTCWDRDRKEWHVPLSWAACVQFRGVFGSDLRVGPNLLAWAQDWAAARIRPAMELREADDGPEVPLPEGLGLEPRQRAGVAFLATARQALLADGMGSGKTVQLICALEELDRRGERPYPALIVCPNSMCGTWKREFAVWAPGRRVEVVKGAAPKRRALIESGADVLVMNWEGVRTHTALAGYGMIKLTDKQAEPKELNGIEIRTVVADEAHRAKNPKSQQARALKRVGKQAEFRFAATGTPIANTPEDLWSIMNFVAPHEWPGKTAFIDRYALQSWNNFGGMTVVGVKGETREEMFKILDPRFIRRPTQVVIPNLLEKLPPQLRTIELLPKQRKAYEQMREQLLAELDEGILMATNPLTRMVRLMQLASAYGEIDEDGKMRLTEPSSKLDALDELVEELAGEQLVVFAESRQLIELAAKRMTEQKISHGLITGSITTATRDAYVARFQKGDLQLMLATLGAGGEGITLTAARHVVFIQRSFSLVKDKQAEDRVWRRGQDRPVQRIDIEAENTIEEDVRMALAEKGERLEEVARDKEAIRRWLAKK